MRNFLPVLWLAEELPAQSSVQDKLGGVPWGLKPESWPKCRECGKSQSLLAQFVHHAERLDLGREGRVLSIFQCNHDPGMCSTWEGGSGANACFVTEPEDMIDALSVAPLDSPPIEREARILEWLVRDDGLSRNEAELFYSERLWLELPDAINEKPFRLTRMGSVPSWVQSPDEASKDGWHFVGQLDDTYHFFRAPTVEADGVEKCKEYWSGLTHECAGPNFGDGGIAYLFLRFGTGVPEGWFFWQCG